MPRIGKPVSPGRARPQAERDSQEHIPSADTVGRMLSWLYDGIRSQVDVAIA